MCPSETDDHPAGPQRPAGPTRRSGPQANASIPPAAAANGSGGDAAAGQQLIASARTRGQEALSEHESKLLLAAYGIPVVREGLAGSVAEAQRLADTIGFPVVLKGCGPLLHHKTEADVIDLGVTDRANLARAFRRISAVAPTALDGVLVQEMVRGSRELAMGLLRDPQFGPCVLFGLGGVLAEVLDDTAFRVAPFDRLEAQEMIGDIRARKILDPFRGEPRADIGQLCDALQALGRIGCDHPQISEIDINPLIIGPDGRIVAVDALVVLS